MKRGKGVKFVYILMCIFIQHYSIAINVPVTVLLPDDNDSKEANTFWTSQCKSLQEWMEAFKTPNFEVRCHILRRGIIFWCWKSNFTDVKFLCDGKIFWYPESNIRCHSFIDVHYDFWCKESGSVANISLPPSKFFAQNHIFTLGMHPTSIYNLNGYSRKFWKSNSGMCFGRREGHFTS